MCRANSWTRTNTSRPRIGVIICSLSSAPPLADLVARLAPRCPPFAPPPSPNIRSLTRSLARSHGHSRTQATLCSPPCAPHTRATACLPPVPRLVRNHLGRPNRTESEYILVCVAKCGVTLVHPMTMEYGSTPLGVALPSEKYTPWVWPARLTPPLLHSELQGGGGAHRPEETPGLCNHTES